MLPVVEITTVKKYFPGYTYDNIIDSTFVSKFNDNSEIICHICGQKRHISPDFNADQTEV